MKKSVLDRIWIGPPAFAALEKLQQIEARSALRDVELQLLELVKKERDPVGPRREVNLHLASPHFQIHPEPVPVKPEELDQRPRSIEAVLAIQGEMRRKKEAAAKRAETMRRRARERKESR